MHLFDGKKVILRTNNYLVFELMLQLSTFYLGPTPRENPENFLPQTPFSGYPSMLQSKDGVDFAMLFPLWESRRTSDLALFRGGQ